MDLFMLIQKETQESKVSGYCNLDPNENQLDFSSLLLIWLLVRLTFLAFFKLLQLSHLTFQALDELCKHSDL